MGALSTSLLPVDLPDTPPVGGSHQHHRLVAGAIDVPIAISSGRAIAPRVQGDVTRDGYGVREGLGLHRRSECDVATDVSAAVLLLGLGVAALEDDRVVGEQGQGARGVAP